MSNGLSHGQVRRFVVALAVVAAGSLGPLRAQSAPTRPDELRAGPDSVSTVAGSRYARGWLYRQFFGTRYRTAWAAPIQVPVLDLRAFAGGLKPLKKGGGKQTRSLRFDGADGRQYVFRTVDKDPVPAIDPALRSDMTIDLFQDQISAGHPTAPLAVAPILRAVGVLHAQPILVFMPDDPALGEFRTEFANTLGMVEERPQDPEEGEPGFADADRIVDSDDLYDELEKNPDVRVSTRDFLAARLTDVFLGDWDRHRDQWEWVLKSDSGSKRWLPLPRDRDQAFIRYDGLVLKILRGKRPELVEFGPTYSPIIGATWNGRDLDRRLLTDVERAVWDSIAMALTARITDSVIDEAVAALPPEHRRITGPALASALKVRRDGLHAQALRYYGFLASEVDVVGSDADEVVTVDRVDRDTVVVELRRAGKDEPLYRRRFVGRETNEVRIYLHGGADSAIVRGAGSAPIGVRIVGGGGDDRFFDESGAGRTGFYDDKGDNRSVGRGIDGRSYDAYGDTTGVDAPMPYRDWGGGAGFFPIASFHSNRGSLIGVGYRIRQYRFRRVPYADQIEYRAEIGPMLSSGRLQLDWRHPLENSRNAFQVHAMVSGVEIARWYGFGNETSNDIARPTDYYHLNPYQLSVVGGMEWGLAEDLTLTTAFVAKYTATDMARSEIANRFIAADRPFGTGGVAQMGGQVNLRFRRVADRDEALTSGVRAELNLAGYPAVLDLPRPVASVGGRVSVSVTAPIPLRPTVAFQVGGQRILGTAGMIPFYEAAVIGSWNSLRGFKTGRFAGDAAVYGSAELRLQLASLPLLVPARQGVFGYYDRGRVFLSGESSSTWHDGYGGGIWLAFRPSGTILSLGAGRSVEGTRLYLRLGFAY